MLYIATENTRIDFTIPSDSALRRIIVDPDVKPVGVWLGNKRIEQVATYIKGAKAEQAFFTPNNLTMVHRCSASIGMSAIWSDFAFKQVGDPSNQAPLGEALKYQSLEKLDPLPVSHYMSETESHLIEQWAGRVVETADPNEILPEAPVAVEGRKKIGRTRNIKPAEDNDEDNDEDDDDQEITLPAPLSVPTLLNDALNSQFDAQKARIGRTRIKKIDVDEEEDESEDSLPANNSEDQTVWTYPPLASPNNVRSHRMPSGKTLGRQRVIKVDSDDDIEDNDFSSPVRERQSWDSDRSPVIHNPLDQTEMSTAWDESVYPQILDIDATNGSSGRNREPVGWDDETSLQKYPAPSHSDKPSLPVEWSHFAAETSNNNSGREPPRRGRGRGRGNRGQRQLPTGNTSNTLAPSSYVRDCADDSHGVKATNQLSRIPLNSKNPRASRGSAPSGKGKVRGNQSVRGGNKFGVLAADTLVDIAESDVVEARTIPPPPGFGHQEPARRPGAQAVPSGDVVVNATPNIDLIDIAGPEEEKVRLFNPPPSFEYISGSGTQAQIGSQCGRSSVVPRRERSLASVESQIIPSISNTGEFYVNTSNPGMDLVEMSKRRLKQLQRARKESHSQDTLTETLQQVDEASTRTYHTTMNQQARKPAVKKAVDQKKAEAMQDAWGSSPSSIRSKASNSTIAASTRSPEDSQISTAKKRLLRGKEPMPTIHPEAANEEQIISQNNRFVAVLLPVFKAARAFPGEIRFEVQLGQFLSPSPEGPYQARCVTVKQWHRLYDSAHGRLASAATFTNILTRNGADVDHILGLKIRGGGATKLFHADTPGLFGIRFEFHCQGKNNDEFKLVLNSKGDYEIERPLRKIGQVNLHVPGQIWDAAGILMGSTRFPEEQALKDAAEELAKSVYIPGGRKEIEMSYRLPSSNEFAVKRVVMRRVSRHTCAILDKHDVQLQITEVQRLFVERRANGIYLAYASKYERMVDQMMLHFEVSLISDSIERAISANANLTIGDITTAWTEDSLLQKWRTKTLLEITRMVISKIDGVGFHNIGSAVFFLGQDSVLAAGSAVAIGSQLPNVSTTKLATQTPQPVINVPGVRGGLAQPINQGYALGYGGARIPIPGVVGQEIVAPDDSASQAPERSEAQGQGQSQVMPGFW
jgi:hypothetical protein